MAGRGGKKKKPDIPGLDKPIPTGPVPTGPVPGMKKKRRKNLTRGKGRFRGRPERG